MNNVTLECGSVKQSFCITMANLISPESKWNLVLSDDFTGKVEGLLQ